MTTYKLFKDPVSQQVVSVFKIEEDSLTWSIPLVHDNTDYQAYLKWVAEGNTPLPAENT